jgi:hypothetical protein
MAILYVKQARVNPRPTVEKCVRIVVALVFTSSSVGSTQVPVAMLSQCFAEYLECKHEQITDIEHRVGASVDALRRKAGITIF